MERVNGTVIKVQKRLSERARKASQLRQRGWEEKEIWLAWIVFGET